MATEAKLSGTTPSSISEPDGAGYSSEAPVRIDDARALWEKLCGLALRGMDRMLSLEPKIVREKDRKYIHDFRVASRRLEQRLDLLSPPLMPQASRRLRRKVKRSRRAFSEVRNCDVLIKWSERHLARKHTAYPAAWEAMLDYLRERQPKARARALRKLTKLNLAKAYLHLQDALRISVPESESGTDGFSVPLEKGYLSGQLSEQLEKKWRRFEKDLADSQRSPDGESVHRVRIATKRLRYLIEIMREFEAAGCNEALDWLRELQRRLGGWHDLYVMEQVMAETLARPLFLRSQLEAAWEMMKLMRQNRKAISRLQDEHAKLGLASEQGQWVAGWVESQLAGRRSRG